MAKKQKDLDIIVAMNYASTEVPGGKEIYEECVPYCGMNNVCDCRDAIWSRARRLAYQYPASTDLLFDNTKYNNNENT